MPLTFQPMFDLDELMQTVMFVLGIFCGASAATTFAKQAPEGYEDDSGFHFS